MTDNTQEAPSEAERKAPVCPFCHDQTQVTLDDIDGWIGYVSCTGCDMRGPISEWKYEDQDEAKADGLKQWYKGLDAVSLPKAQVTQPTDNTGLIERLNTADPLAHVRAKLYEDTDSSVGPYAAQILRMLPMQSAPPTQPSGDDIWEALFSIFAGNVPDEMTEDVCAQLACYFTAGEQ